jgi:signal transduction histidine kinase
VVLAGLLAGGGGLIFYLLPPFLGLDSVSPNAIGLLVLTYPISIAIAILRHNLFNIETLINRTLVYGALTTGTMLIYVGIVSIGGMFLLGQESGTVAFITTGLIALMFQPLRIRLQRIVNRFMYGDRDDPYMVLKTLGSRLQNTLAPQDVIPAIVETVSTTLKLPFAAITLLDGECIDFGMKPRNVETQSFQLAYQGEIFGRLEVAPRSANEPLTEDELQLINDLTRQIEVAVHDVRLNSDLQRSRQRLVTTREEERRRIRRDLHDGLGPQLASQILTLEAMDKLLDSDPDAARSLLQNLKSQSSTAIEDVRRLIYGLRPPALDDLGLIEALRQEIHQFPEPPEVKLAVPDNLPPLSAAIELAIYRIVQEAVNNIVKHANASHCTVTIKISSAQINVHVADDGGGIGGRIKKGIGMQSMRERAEELGGDFDVRSQSNSGTIITVSIPMKEVLDE